MRPALQKEQFDLEKNVIIEEIRMYHDQPPFGADDTCKAVYFERHPLANSILGTEESIRDLALNQMRRYFADRYCPANITLAASGRVDFDSLVEQAARLTANWDRGSPARPRLPAAGRSSFQVIQRDSATQQYVMHLTAAPSSFEEDRYAAKLLTVILGDDQGSRLYWELMDPGLVESISLGHHDYYDCGAYMTYMSSAPAVAQDSLEKFLDVYATAEQEGFMSKELEQAKSKINSRLVLSSEKPRNRLFAVGGNWLLRREYRSVRDDLDTVEQLTLDDIHAVLAKYPLSRGTIVAIGPDGSMQAPW
jgi:predicted Zn-dependent peptidase